MKSCKDCIHFKDVCEEHGLYFENEYLKNVAFSENIKDLCHGFKDKADFVEVRCKECKHFTEEMIGDTLECICKNARGMINPAPDFYCSYGERRDT